MISNKLIALLTAIALQANPTVSAIPTQLDAPVNPPTPIQVIVPPTKIKIESLGVRTNAPSVIVADMASGSVLYAKNAEVARPIASLTKLMTAMVVIDTGLHPDDLLMVSSNAIEAGEGSHYFNGGEAIPRGIALQAMLSQSVNELANAFADAYPGGRSAFVDAMNAKARVLGLEQTSFSDPSGLNPKNVASALDVATMLRSASAYPEIRDADKMQTMSFNTNSGRAIHLKTTNDLAGSYLNKDPYSIVVAKTGSLPEAGFCLGQVTRGTQGQQVVAVALGSTDTFSRFQDVKALTGWAFEAYKW
ncbi:MAG: serine hydrolase [Patescibacteria group bacterium]